MTKTELIELLHNGENSGVEFKRDDLVPEKLAKGIAALLNLEGGHILLGVEKDGTVSGLTREPYKAEEWVMQVARDSVQPALNPYWESLEWESGKVIGIISLAENAPDKPYKAKKRSTWVTQIRVGTTTRDATREEEARLYQQSGQLRYGLKPVLGTSLDSLDLRRLRHYFEVVTKGTAPADNEFNDWEVLLRNVELMTGSAAPNAATVDGVLLFGRKPERDLPQSGIRAVCYTGPEPDYATRADEQLRGPLLPLRTPDEDIMEAGLVEQAWDFVRRNTTPTAHLEGPQRRDRWQYPKDVVREVVVNALVHRDYSVLGTDVMLSIFSDRLVVQSPGRLPNTVTVEGIKSGMRYARNQTLVNVMRDYGYVEARGMGVRNRIIPGMRNHNGTEPDLIEDECSFTVSLLKDPR